MAILPTKSLRPGIVCQWQCLLPLKQDRKKVIDFLNDTIAPDSYHHCDRYWILLRELEADCPEFKRYRGDSGLKFLIEKKVHFIKPITAQI